MPFLPFEAVDSNGKTIKGTLQANNQQELEAILRSKGLRPTTAIQRPAVPVQRPEAVRSAPAVRPTVPVPTQSAISKPAHAATEKTPELSNKEVYFMFSQFASFFRSGFSSSQMIHHSAAKSSSKLTAMFARMEAEVAGGMALSDSMAKRPRTFHTDQIATVQAGERSGQMAEAFDIIALQAERTRAFRMTLNYFFFMAPLLILCGIGGMGLQKASTSAIRLQNDADGKLSPWGTLGQEFVRKGTSDLLIAFIVVTGFIAAIVILHKYPFRRLRHSVGIMNPIGYTRGKAEAIERFSWSMSTMLKGGSSPASAVHIAVSSIPNLVLRERALSALGSTRENEPLGSVLQRTGLLSQEYVHMVENGELVGDTPGALAHVMNAEKSTFESRTGALKVFLSVVTTVAMAAFAFVMLIILYKLYAEGLIKLINEQ